MSVRFTVFDSALGPAALVFGDQGIIGAFLPEDDPASLRARIHRLYPGAEEAEPEEDLVRAIERVRDLMDGADDDLADLPLDMSGIGEFERSVYAIARRVRPGQTITYGDIARELGDLTLSQAIGRAMGRNPFPPIVPCHRVVAAGQKLGGFSAAGGRSLKLKLLEIERRWARDDLFGQNV